MENGPLMVCRQDFHGDFRGVGLPEGQWQLINSHIVHRNIDVDIKASDCIYKDGTYSRAINGDIEYSNNVWMVVPSKKKRELRPHWFCWLVSANLPDCMSMESIPLHLYNCSINQNRFNLFKPYHHYCRHGLCEWLENPSLLHHFDGDCLGFHQRSNTLEMVCGVQCGGFLSHRGTPISPSSILDWIFHYK